MHSFHAALLAAHIATGTVAVFAFWLPVIARKGGRFHITAGRAYTGAMYAVSVTAIVMSVAVLLDPVGIRFPDRDLSMETAFAVANGNRMFALFLLMLGLLVLGAMRHGLLALRVRRGEDALASNGLIGTGIGAYTALFAFGGREFLSGLLTGQWQVLPWIAPAIIGTLATARLKRQYSEARATRQYRARSAA